MENIFLSGLSYVCIVTGAVIQDTFVNEWKGARLSCLGPTHCVAWKRFVWDNILVAEEIEDLLSCPVMRLSKVLYIIEVHGHVLVEDFKHSWEALPGVLAAEGDARVAQSTRISETLLQGCQLGLVLLHRNSCLP